MGNFLRLSAGVPRSFAESFTPVTIYDQSLTVVSSGAVSGQINGPVLAGTSVTLPAAQTYTAGELQIYLNGDRLEPTFDYTYVGSPPRTQVQFTFDLAVGDRIDFRIDRSP
jgi:hypothetical protein